MCGIIGYTGNRSAGPILLEGLSNLEYRGYDSAGIAIIDDTGALAIRKSKGKLGALKATLEDSVPEGSHGVGHTRWATHGSPSDVNSHPHTDCNNQITVVHNGIVENFLELREELESSGHLFASQTDSECIPHLIESYIQRGYDLISATREMAGRIRGAHAIVLTCQREPGKLVALRLGNAGGIVVGYGQDEMLIASDLPALLPHTNKVVYLAAGELVSTTSTDVEYSRLDGTPLKKTTVNPPYDSAASAKGQYTHFMLKEISEQPETVIDSMRGRVLFDSHTIDLEDIPLSEQEIRAIQKVVFVGMGTSLHAAMVARSWTETLARIPAEADNSSEFRYRDPIIDENTLVVSVCQSGETADTLAAMEQAKSRGARQITICNYEGSQTTRVADGTMLIRAGPEIGVASSKSFMCSLTTLYLLALHLASKRGSLSKKNLGPIVQELAQLPEMLGSLIANQQQYEELAQDYAKYSNFLFLGRGIHHPLAMEGALKLKEISYIHAEGYPAGEMKHGPISLIDEKMPIVALTPSDHLYAKMLNNVNEVKARNGMVIAIATEDNSEIASIVDRVIYIPNSSSILSPMLLAIPMQLLAYHIATNRGCDVDQPRNLAKSVTVE